MITELDVIDHQDLTQAVRLLESPSILSRLTSLTDSSIKTTINKLPASAIKILNNVAEASLKKAAKLAFISMGNKPSLPASSKLHKLLAATAGAAGGAFGSSSLLLELPISTTIIMRAVADIARSEGFNLQDITTQHYCIEVFALATDKPNDDSAEAGYYMTRGFLTQSMQHLNNHLSKMATTQTTQTINAAGNSHGGKWLEAIISKVTRKFGLVITHKLAAQAIPVIGAVTGATINTLFINFYQDMARGHFIVKRLEKKYGVEVVKDEYQKIYQQLLPLLKKHR